MSSRERSFWAWGFVDRFPDDDARRALAARAGAALGGDELVLGALPSIESARVPEARVAVPPDLAPFANTDRRERITHTYGRAYRDVLRGYEGDFSPAPDLVVRPRDEVEIARAMAWCEAENVALVPFGGGTSVVGGVETVAGERYRGVASLDLGSFDRVVEIDTASRAARIQAGARGPALEEQLAPHGLSLRFYPQSFEHSTLGGWIATRAGGHYATRLTHIDDVVESIRMVAPRGVLESRRLPASGAGPSPDRMLLGSEGILGIITEAWVRVQSRPRWRSTASVFFDDLPAAGRGARDIVQAGLSPANCRALDAHEALMNGVPTDGGAVLVLGFESADHPTAASMDRALAIASGGRCPKGAKHRDGGERGGDASSESWRDAFLGAPYLQSALVTLGVVADTFETACTWDRFAALHAGVIEATTDAMLRTCGGGFVTCRLTHVYPDGVAPYFTFVAPARGGGELERWGEIKRAASDAILAHGGTITHHHAVGRMHRPWYDRQRPDLFADALRSVKRTLDPHGIMNPGVLVDT